MGRAGEPRRSILKPLIALVLILGVAAAAVGYVAVPNVRQRVDSAIADLRRMIMPTLEDVHPRGEGTGEPDHLGANAADDNKATYWLVNPTAVTPLLRVTFAAPVELGALVFHSGSSTQSEFILHRRPKAVELRFPDTNEAPLVLSLADVSDDQRLPVDSPVVQVIEIRILDSYPSAAGGDEFVALREIEFKARR